MCTTYIRNRFNVPAHLIEDFCGWLWCYGEPLGLEISEEGVDAYYEARASTATRWLSSRWTGQGVELLARERLAADDWLAGYRRRSAPFALGRGFWVDAGEPLAAVSPPPGRRLLRLPARRAFGTGSHESTRLVVSWLEELPVDGQSVLDVGTGSGILSFVARCLGAARVVGVERDLQAALLAGVNRELNRMPVGILAGELAALGSRRFDVVVVNVDPLQVLAEAAAIARRVAPRGRLVYSGALRGRESEVLEAFARADLSRAGEKVDGEWGSWLLVRGRLP